MITFQFSTLAGENVPITRAVLLPDGVETISIERRTLVGNRDWVLGEYLNLSFLIYLEKFDSPSDEYERLNAFSGQKGELVFTGTTFPTSDSTQSPLRFQLIAVTPALLTPEFDYDLLILDFLALEVTATQIEFILSDPDGLPILSDPGGTGIIADT